MLRLEDVAITQQRVEDAGEAPGAFPTSSA